MKLVYFARSQSSGLIKIGCTLHLARRMKSLSLHGRKMELVATVPGDFALEKYCLELAATKAMQCKGEWFGLEDGHLREIIAAAGKHVVPEAINRIIVKKDAPFLVRFEPTLKDAVVRRAKTEGMSAAAIIRMAVRAFLEPRKGGK